MRRGYRQERIGVEIRKIISDMLLREIKDPRLSDGMVSITDVEVTRDGSYAKVFFTVYANEEDTEAKARAIEGLEHCKGLIKREIGQRMDLRRVPELLFEIDNSFEYGQRMDALIEKAVKNDEK